MSLLYVALSSGRTWSSTKSVRLYTLTVISSKPRSMIAPTAAATSSIDWTRVGCDGG